MCYVVEYIRNNREAGECPNSCEILVHLAIGKPNKQGKSGADTNPPNFDCQFRHLFLFLFHNLRSATKARTFLTLFWRFGFVFRPRQHRFLFQITLIPTASSNCLLHNRRMVMFVVFGEQRTHIFFLYEIRTGSIILSEKSCYSLKRSDEIKRTSGKKLCGNKFRYSMGDADHFASHLYTTVSTMYGFDTNTIAE